MEPYLLRHKPMKLSNSTFFGDFQIPVHALIFAAFLVCSGCQEEKDQGASAFSLTVEQLTSGSKHHFFGYIGQSKTIPWNESGQYILGMEIDTINRMPKPNEAAIIFVLDTHNDYKIIPLDRTFGWNPQQGTMFYWNPLASKSQFFFNDKDTATGKVFTVLYDISERKRVKEFRFADTPIANGGVAPDGTAWLGLNYGRMARLRRVTGYPGAVDWSSDAVAPTDDGIFKVDMESGEKELLVSYFQLDQKIREENPDLQHTGLFINHTLWNRDSELIYFFARAGWSGNNGDGERVNVPFTIHADGTGLTRHPIFIGGHPEWGEGTTIIGSAPDESGTERQVVYDVEKRKIVGYLGDSDLFPDPEGDISLSPDGNWFANGYSEDTLNYYSVLRRSDGAWAKSEGISKGQFGGDIRIDPAPRWNRTNDAILVPGLAKNGTRQMFVLRVNTEAGN